MRGKEFMTIREFAALCGVSPATVSRCFSGQGSVSAEVRETIEAMARKTGYRPPEGYRTRRKANAAIAVLMPGLRLTFFDDVIEELQRQAEALDKQIVIVPMDLQEPRRTLSVLQMLLPVGVILLDERAADPIADALSRENRAVVVCGARTIGRRFSSVHIDDLMAAYDGTQYLLARGHRRICLLSDDHHAISSGFQRVTGCRKALDDARIPLDDEQIVYCGTRFQDGYEGARTLLAQNPDMTALFAFSDDMAAGAIQYLRDVGKRVPADISVLGFDDSTTAERVRPRLTTVHQPISQIARKSLEYLIELQRTADISSLTLPYRIVERESVRSI